MYQQLLHFLNLLSLQNWLNLNNLNCSFWRCWFWKIFTHLYYVFFINPTVKRIIIAFPFNLMFITFSFYYFFDSKLFLISFFVARSSNFFVFKIINNKCSRHSFYTLFNHKNFFRPIQNMTFSKMFLYSDIVRSPILNLGTLLSISLLESIYVLNVTPRGFILIVLWDVLQYLLTIWYNLSTYNKMFFILKSYTYKTCSLRS